MSGGGGGGGGGGGAGATELEGVELGGGDAEDLADLVDVAALVLMCVALPMGFLHEANKQKQEWARLRRASR